MCVKKPAARVNAGAESPANAATGFSGVAKLEKTRLYQTISGLIWRIVLISRTGLLRLPNFQRTGAGKYEGFVLMREGGAPSGGGENQLYTVPAADASTMYLPAGLFLNGWIHLLEDSELAFLLMLSCLRSRFGKMPVFATSEVRLLQFGLGRDAYEAQHLLSLLWIVRIHADPHQGRRLGKTGRYLRSDPPKLHRFELVNETFGEPAIPIMREVMNHILVVATGTS